MAERERIKSERIKVTYLEGLVQGTEWRDPIVCSCDSVAKDPWLHDAKIKAKEILSRPETKVLKNIQEPQPG
jgi:hypothetical protein